LKSIDWIYAFLTPFSFDSCFLLSSILPLLPVLRPPLLAAMASSLSTSRYQFENDLRALRKAIGWQSLGYDSMMWHGMLSLAQPGDFVYILAYALAGLVPPFSSFFHVLLEHYGLQLQHLSPHSITLVVIFTHFYEMLVGVRPLVHLFRQLHVPCPVNRQCAVVGALVPAVARAAPSEQAATSLRWLLLLAPNEGFFEVPCRPQP
jgi:hypothetical protein